MNEKYMFDPISMSDNFYTFLVFSLNSKSISDTVGENIIAAIKMRNNYGAIQSFKIFNLLCLVAPFLVSVLCIFLMALFLKLSHFQLSL